MSRHATINRAYRLIWSDLHQAFIAVAEIARGHGKRSGGRSILIGALLAAGVMVGGSANAAPPVDVGALPAGAQVTAGVAAVSQSGNVMSVSQSTDKAAINWQSFSVGSAAQVNFYQPSSNAVVLNRVVGNEQSVINGAINANGRVFILNSSGVLFGQGASVNTSGLVASTMNMSDADFMAGNYRFHKNGSAASVVNLGTINVTDGGYVALLGEKVVNQGVITARMGTVAMASGEKVTLNFNGDSMVGVTVDQAALNALVENRNAIYADGGQVILSAKAVDKVLENVVNNTGTIRAQTIENREGKIFLLGEGGKLEVSGVLDASAPNGGDGGFVETSGPTVKVHDAAVITTASAQGKTGTWLLDPVNISISESGTDDPSSVPSVPGNATVSNVTLQNQLVNTNIVLEATNDVDVNAPLSWSSVNDPAKGMLTLKAGNNVNVNAPVVVSGYGRMALNAGKDVNVNAVMEFNGSSKLDVTTGTLATTGVVGYLNMGFDSKGEFKGKVNFGTRSGAGIIRINSDEYFVINSLGNQGSVTGQDLQGVSGNLSGRYVLGDDISAEVTNNWGPTGFSPIGYPVVLADGKLSNVFTGTFDGLGHAVRGLYIDRSNSTFGSTDYVGIFGAVSGGLVQNLALSQTPVGVISSISGVKQVGGIVGWLSEGGVRNSYVQGEVIATGTQVGGVVGVADRSSFLSGVYSTATVNGSSYVGGVLGYGDTVRISGAYSTGAVTGSSTAVGGLVGGLVNTGSSQTLSQIRDAFSTSSVTITGVGNTGGGLVGTLSGAGVYNSFSVGTVFVPRATAGGLVGSVANSTIENSYSTSSVTGRTAVGGLVGAINDVATLAYGTTIIKTYANGPVRATQNTFSGGLIGQVLSTSAPVVASSFWDVNSTGQVGSLGGSGAQGKTTAELSNKALYVNAGWDFTLADGTPSIWGYNRINGVQNNLNSDVLKNGTNARNNTTPHLCTFYACQLSSLTLKAVSTYGSSLLTSSDVVGYLDGENVSKVGTAVFNNAPDSKSNATSNFSGVTYAGGLELTGVHANYYELRSGSVTSWEIKRADLTEVSGTKVYDANKAFDGASLTVKGVNGEYLALTGTAYSDTKDVLTASKFSDFTALVLSNGSGIDAGLASNYNLAVGVGGINRANITKKAVTASGITASNKVYDTTTVASLNVAGASLTTGAATATDHKVYSSDTVDLVTGTASGAFADKHAGDGKAVTVSGLSLSGADAGNYTVTDASNATANIAKKEISITAVASDKVYDGSRAATVTVNAIGGLVGAETVTTTAIALFDTKDAGNTKSVTAGYTLGDGANGGLAGNYVVASSNALTATIAKRALTVAAAASDKVYDGNTNATVSINSLTGFVGTETVGATATGVFSSKDAGARTVTASYALSDGSNGGLANNYQLADSTGLTATIGKKTLTVSATVADKTYDGNTVATVGINSLTGFVGTETVGATATGVFNSKDAGARTVTASYALSDGSNGGLASNYQLADSTGLTATIGKKKITVAATASDRPYDETTVANISVSTASGLVGTEQLQISGTGNFDSKEVGNRVATANFSLSNGANGGLASNYEVDPATGLVAKITPPGLTYAVNRIGGQVGPLMYSGSDLLASSIVSDTSLKGLFAGMGAPEVIGYSITRDGVAVSSIKESGNYVIRPIFGANGNYEINEAASSPLSIVVAANSIIEEAVATAQKSRPAAVNPNEIKPTSINDGLSKVVSIPSLGDSPRNVTLSEVSQSYSTPTQLALDLIFEDTAAGPLTGQQLSLDLFPSSIKLGNATSSSRINVLSLGKEFRPATKTVNKTAGADRDVRVQVVRDSLLGVVNGGVKLPEGVSQEFYAVGGWQTVKVKESHESSDKYSMEATPAGAFAVVGGAR